MPNDVGGVEDEFVGAELGDRRLSRRLLHIARAAAEAPDRSLPEQAGSDAALEGTYRFLNNESVQPEAVLAVHLERTAQRAEQMREVIVCHDTTQFAFSGASKREGLGPLRSGPKQGFFGHFSLALTIDGRPLGLLALDTWIRSAEPRAARTARQLMNAEDRESLRWFEGARAAKERLCNRATAIHVMDREGDSYELFARLIEDDQRFVIRLSHDRRVVRSEPGPKLFTTMSRGTWVLEREVPLSRRKHARVMAVQHRIHPERDARRALLHIRACSAEVACSTTLVTYLPAGLLLNFVEVSEPEPPEGETAVTWRLATTEPVDTAEQVARVVDIYRRRWLIEEYFKALKTGCAYEKRQLDSAAPLLVGLVIFSVVAWRMLLLRWLDRNAGHEPAAVLLDKVEIDALGAAYSRRSKKSLPPNPTVHEVLTAIAALGGHIRNNGPPGWQVLGRGFDTLLLIAEGWRAALQSPGLPAQM